MLIDFLLKKSVQQNFSSTEWHKEMVRLMREEAKKVNPQVSDAMVMRKAIEFLATNFDKSIFVENTAGKSDSVVEQVTGTSRVNPRPAFGRNVGRGSSKRVHVSSIPGRER